MKCKTTRTSTKVSEIHGEADSEGNEVPLDDELLEEQMVNKSSEEKPDERRSRAERVQRGDVQYDRQRVTAYIPSDRKSKRSENGTRKGSVSCLRRSTSRRGHRRHDKIDDPKGATSSRVRVPSVPRREERVQGTSNRWDKGRPSYQRGT